MRTAKNLQLLDSQNVNVSPAVGVESLYFEDGTGANNIIRRRLYDKILFIGSNGSIKADSIASTVSSDKISIVANIGTSYYNSDNLMKTPTMGVIKLKDIETKIGAKIMESQENFKAPLYISNTVAVTYGNTAFTKNEISLSYNTPLSVKDGKLDLNYNTLYFTKSNSLLDLNTIAPLFSEPKLRYTVCDNTAIDDGVSTSIPSTITGSATGNMVLLGLPASDVIGTANNGAAINKNIKTAPVARVLCPSNEWDQSDKLPAGALFYNTASGLIAQNSSFFNLTAMNLSVTNDINAKGMVLANNLISTISSIRSVVKMSSEGNVFLTNVSITKDCVMDANCTISSNVSITGNCTAENFYASSDERLKTNISGVISTVPTPEVKQFVWKSSGEPAYGFIAQELENKGLNELVETNKETGYKTVNYNSALALAIAKLQQDVEILKKEVKELKENQNK